jgi:hypothetical protein
LVHIVDTRGGVTRKVGNDLLKWAGSRARMDLYVSHKIDDPTPATPPPGLAAKALGPSEVELTWGESRDPESGVVPYVVYRDGKEVARTRGRRYPDSGLSDSTRYVYSVSAVNGGLVESRRSTARATTLPDTTPPKIASASASGDPTEVRLTFTEAVDPRSASDASNYSMAGGARVLSASLADDGRTAVLETTRLVEGTRYVVSVSGVTDRAKRPNTLEFGTSAGFEYVASGDGLLGDYFANKELRGEPRRRVDPEIRFSWPGSPMPGIGADGFSVRWTGRIRPDFGEEYTFHATTDDGVRVWVDGEKIIDWWRDQAPTESRGTAELRAGHMHEIRVEYYESGGGASAELGWSSASQAKEIVPKRCLYSDRP